MTLILGGTLPQPWRAAMAWSTKTRNLEGEHSFFRRTVKLDAIPDSVRIFVSADSRYRLFVNGALVGRGPLKGTLARYHVEEYEIAPLLRVGANVLAADVVWFGPNPPLSEEHSGYPGFVLQGPRELEIDTPGFWKALSDSSMGWDFTPYTSNAHIFLGGFEHIQVSKAPIGWTDRDFDDSSWNKALDGVKLNLPGGNHDADVVWNFAPRDIPQLPEIPRRFTRTIQSNKAATHLFGDQPQGWSVAPGEAGDIVLDAGALTCGYPVFQFDPSPGRTVEIVYVECALRAVPGTESDTKPYRWGAGGRLVKGVRDDIDGCVWHGYQDTISLDDRSFIYEPHHWRTFWYVHIKVSAGPKAFTLRDATHRFTTYPQTCLAHFESPSEPEIRQLWDTSWRTLQLCSHETYEDCPGYEQLNYLLDARNEAMTSLWVAGERALPRRTISLFRETLQTDGMLASRTPSSVRQNIPLFALWWVQMVQDYWDYCGKSEQEFVRSNLYAVDGVLWYFRNRMSPEGSIGPLSYWNPIGGEDAPGTDLDPSIKQGGSSYVTALTLTGVESAIRLHREAGFSEDADRWMKTRSLLRDAISAAWSEERGVFVESIRRPNAVVSQHTQATVILSGAATPEQARRAAESAASDTSPGKMTRQAGLAFSQAMRLAGTYHIAARQYLAEYREQLGLHLSTWVEGPLEGRSDCHAWSAWLPVELLSSVLGIQPIKPGFAEILIAPNPVLAEASGAMPTPQGEVSVRWKSDGHGKITQIEANTPSGIPTTLQLSGQPARRFEEGGAIKITN